MKLRLKAGVTKTAIGGLAWLCATAGALAAEPRTSERSANVARQQQLIDRYCVTCHNDGRKSGNVSLESVNFEDVSETADVWEKVVHKVRTLDMPPPDKRQPSRRARKELLSWLTASLDAAADRNPDPGRPAVHRLNRAEYTNAIRDLLALEIDAKQLLPTDGTDYGFDNIADSLNVSPLLLERYMLAASKISRKAIGDASVGAVTQTYTVSRDLLQTERLGDEFPFGSRGGIAVKHFFPIAAEYTIKVNTSGAGADPHQVEVRVDGARVGLFTAGGPKKPVKKGPAKNESKKQDAVKAKQDGEKASDDWGKKKPTGMFARFEAGAGTHVITVAFVNKNVVPEGIGPRTLPVAKIGGGGIGVPKIAGFEINGPLKPEGMSELVVGDSPSRNQIFVRYPSSKQDESSCASEILSALAQRAYRRPIGEGDIATLMAFYEAGREDGGFEEGVRSGLERILVDPEFLFRVEADPPDVEPDAVYALSDLEIASRLSFFLWSSIPDDELIAVAQRGELSDPAILEQQVGRMLTDPKSESLVNNFASQWLYLRNMRIVTPDANLFPDFDDNLRDAMRRETELFVSSQIREDRSVIDLLGADYTYLNERLARHYGIPGVYGSRFRRVKMTDGIRGGLLGQGSILTVTSYATRTSPVLRGKWLLQNILGSPPPPPPADVPDLPETDEAGEAATVRERLRLHSSDPTCASCHVKMDPLGFALENFDGIGKWRTQTLEGLPVDSMGILPDGTEMDGPAGLRKAMLGRSEEFIMTVAQKLLTYALGRGIEYYDRPAIRKIMRDAAADDYRWSSLILGIVKSTPFQMRRSS